MPRSLNRKAINGTIEWIERRAEVVHLSSDKIKTLGESIQRFGQTTVDLKKLISKFKTEATHHGVTAENNIRRWASEETGCDADTREKRLTSIADSPTSGTYIH